MEPATARFEHFPHDADAGIAGIGPTPEEAFRQGALALTAVVTDPELVQPREAVAIACEGDDLDLLFVDWLNALVYEMATRNMLFADFQVRLEGDRLEAVARGEAVDVARHAPQVEVKGATYTSLSVARGEDGLWRAQCVVDV